ncbi:MAG: cytochrome c3 family protein [Nitrospirota bacterium]
MYAVRKYKILTGLLFLMAVFLYSGITSGGSIKHSVHGEKAGLPAGCGSCHKGHGVKGTPMLPSHEKDFCFTCHGSQSRQRNALNSKKLSHGKLLKNIEDDFKKVYHHPIEIEGVHSPDEVLPEIDSSKPRHATCMDCHNPHKVERENALYGVDGAKRKVKIRNSVNEFEICYKCHSYSANLPGNQKNKEQEFDPGNRSYHPVEGPGKNSRVPSLIPPLTTASAITCSDCHSGDGYNASKGPHGSMYEHILKKKYVESIRSAESPLNYELCYDCHRRENLLANASWDSHSSHINKTSCRTCHNSHGSRNYPYLIDFNPLAVYPNRDGRLDFVEYGEGRFDCFLKCHDADHNRDGVFPAGISPLKSQKR